MVGRLIDKASQDGRQTDVKNLISKLLEMAPKSDGALSEGLGVTLSTKLRDNTGAFLAAFDDLTISAGQPESEAIKSRALELICTADYLTTIELEAIRDE